MGVVYWDESLIPEHRDHKRDKKMGALVPESGKNG
jgi:hypothetical protein